MRNKDLNFKPLISEKLFPRATPEVDPDFQNFLKMFFKATATEQSCEELLKKHSYNIRSAFIENLWRRSEHGGEPHGDVAAVTNVFAKTTELKKAFRTLSGTARKEFVILHNTDPETREVDFGKPTALENLMDALDAFDAARDATLAHYNESVPVIRSDANFVAISVVARCGDAWLDLSTKPLKIAQSDTGPFASFLKGVFFHLDSKESKLRSPKAAVVAYDSWRKSNSKLIRPISP